MLMKTPMRYLPSIVPIETCFSRLFKSQAVRPLGYIFYACFLLCYFASQNIAAQESYQLSLPEVIEIARSESPDAVLAKTRLNNNYWRFRSFQADLRPQVSLNATLPNLNRSIESITLPDGNEDFISRSLMRNSMSVSLSQPIVATGGQVFLSTGLRRLDIFKNDFNDGSISYLSSPISLGFVQPLRTYNELRWNKKIEPIRYEEQQRAFNEQKETAAAESARLFFDLLIAQLNLEAATKNKANADTLYSISQGRFGVGRIAETDLLQIELSVMNANAAFAQATLNAQTANEQLRRFLGLTGDVNFELIPPATIPDVTVDEAVAMEYANRYRSEILAYERRLLEAEANLDRAVKSNGFQVNLNGQFGLSGTSRNFSEAYADLVDQEVFSVGISVPIADFGKARSRIEVARSNQELEQLNVNQERISLERRVRLQVQQFDLLRNQVDLADRAYEVARRGEAITRKRYLIGKISITELNLAVSSMDSARAQYFSALRNFWLGYYELRRLTLYDFIKGEALVNEE